ncbi:MAG: sulfotransferase domain-containing protein [Coleofasciculus sp. G3-WIS-01]|uniref:sulfotransferase domain-containing protein n=1 Tax=Coleofasciculus sp. G3-WIS-01 TaxID=3069528 RepID=UPI0032FB65D2
MAWNMWIICCGMVRAASTLQYQLTSEIVEYKNMGKSIGWIEPNKFSYFQDKYHNYQGCLIAKCHKYIKEAVDLDRKENAKLIYSFRDIRDIYLSLINKNQSKLSFWTIIQQIESALSDYYSWNKLNNILSSKYEIFTKHLSQEVLRIANHIDIQLSPEEARQISDKFTLARQREKIASFDYNKLGVQVNENTIYDPKSLLHENHIFLGESELWKKEMTKLQLSIIEGVFYAWLVENDYPISQNFFSRQYGAFLYYLHKIKFVDTIKVNG